MTGYVTVKLPKALVDQIDEVLAKDNLGYASRTEFIKDNVRRHLAEIKSLK